MQSSIGTNFPFSLGQTQCSSRFHSPRHTSLTTPSNVSVWRPHILPLDHQIMVSSMIRFHLKWWMDTNHFVTGIPIHPPEPNVFLFTDASHYGWGAHLEPIRLYFHGRWTEDQSQLHINMLEMMAICFAQLKAITFIHHSCVMISNDNTTVVSYINRQGGTHSPNLCIEVWKILGVWNTISLSELVIFQANSIFWQAVSYRQTYQNRILEFGSNDSELHIPSAQLSKCGSGPGCSKRH